MLFAGSVGASLGVTGFAGASSTSVSSRHAIQEASAIASNPTDIPGAPSNVVGGEPSATSSTTFFGGGHISPLFTTPKSSCNESVVSSGNYEACLGARDIDDNNIYVVAGGENQNGSWYRHVELVDSSTGNYWNSAGGDVVTAQNTWLYIGPEMSIVHGCYSFYGVVWQDNSGS
jgi:hypothetical protein